MENKKFEFEKSAMQGLPIPENLNEAEIWLYECLRNLYAYYKIGQIEREDAQKEKNKLIKKYERINFGLKCWNASVERHYAIEESGRRFVQALKDDKDIIKRAIEFHRIVYNAPLMKEITEKYMNKSQ